MTSQVLDTLIIGCGPAGTSTALHLCQRDPSWSKRILMLDRAHHPRDKLCGGILSFLALDALQKLEIKLKSPSVSIANAIFKILETTILLKGEGIFKVIRRSEFDADLLTECKNRGVEVSEGEEVLDLQQRQGDVLVTTSRRTLRARTVVAADGTTGVARRLLLPENRMRLCRLLEVLVPVDPETSWEFRHRTGFSDWTPMSRGIQGYYWEAPSLVDGVPMMNCGIFDSRTNPRPPGISLKAELERIMESRGLDAGSQTLKGFPIRPLGRRDPLSMERVLFVGDAAGSDPLGGEGISFALGYGRVAAAELSTAFQRRNFSFANYRRRLAQDSLFRHLEHRVRLAKYTYLSTNPRLVPWALKLAVSSVIRWGGGSALQSVRPEVHFLPKLSGSGKEEIEPFLYLPKDLRKASRGGQADPSVRALPQMPARRE